MTISAVSTRYNAFTLAQPVARPAAAAQTADVSAATYTNGYYNPYPQYPAYPQYPGYPQRGVMHGIGLVAQGLLEIAGGALRGVGVVAKGVLSVGVGAVGLLASGVVAVFQALGRGGRAIFDPTYGRYPQYPQYPNYYQQPTNGYYR